LHVEQLQGIVPPANRRVDDYVIVSATTVANPAEAEKRGRGREK
jgi:hypothetical protein